MLHVAQLTVSIHASLEALAQPARPTVVSVRPVDGTLAVDFGKQTDWRLVLRLGELVDLRAPEVVLTSALSLARVAPVPVDAALEEARAAFWRFAVSRV